MQNFTILTLLHKSKVHCSDLIFAVYAVFARDKSTKRRCNCNMKISVLINFY
jgi:hypothetical protein